MPLIEDLMSREGFEPPTNRSKADRSDHAELS